MAAHFLPYIQAGWETLVSLQPASSLFLLLLPSHPPSCLGIRHSTLQQSHLAVLQWAQGNLPSSDLLSQSTCCRCWSVQRNLFSPHLIAPLSLCSHATSACPTAVHWLASTALPHSHSPPTHTHKHWKTLPILVPFFLCLIRMKLQSSAFFSTAT